MKPIRSRRSRSTTPKVESSSWTARRSPSTADGAARSPICALEDADRRLEDLACCAEAGRAHSPDCASSSDVEGSRKSQSAARPLSTWPCDRVTSRRLPHELRRMSLHSRAVTHIRRDLGGRIWSRRPDARFACVHHCRQSRTSARRINSAAPAPCSTASDVIVSLSFSALLIAGVWLARGARLPACS